MVYLWILTCDVIICHLWIVTCDVFTCHWWCYSRSVNVNIYTSGRICCLILACMFILSVMYVVVFFWFYASGRVGEIVYFYISSFFNVVLLYALILLWVNCSVCVIILESDLVQVNVWYMLTFSTNWLNVFSKCYHGYNLRSIW